MKENKMPLGIKPIEIGRGSASFVGGVNKLWARLNDRHTTTN